MSRYIPGMGNGSAKLMIVGEAPGRYEEEEGVPFVGPTGEILNELLRGAGIDRGQVYCTNVVKYRPPQNNIKRLAEIGHSIDEGLTQLWEEVRAVNPNCILPLGNIALQAITGRQGITNWRGSILPTERFAKKAVPTIHPAALMHGQQEGAGIDFSAKVYMQMDFVRAVEESQTPELRYPARTLRIAKTSLDVWRFLEQYKNLDLCAVDIETVACMPVCIALAFSRYDAISIPLINIFDDNKIPMHELVHMWDMVYATLARCRIIGQNFKFDHEKLKKVGFYIPSVYFDTMLAAHALHCELPKSLQFLCSIYTREPYYKAEGKEFNPKKDKPDRLYLYNAKDALVTFECYEEMSKNIEEFELHEFFYGHLMKLHDAYMKIEAVGFRVDYEQRRALWKKYSIMEDTAMKELYDLLGYHVNVNSPKQIHSLLYGFMKLPLRKDTSEDTIVALLANNVKSERDKLVLEGVLKIRRIRKTKSTYIASYPDYDGRMRTSFRLGGAETGRTSTSQLKPPLRPHKLGQPFQTLTKHGDIGADIRSIYVPDAGMVFLEVDLSQAEARVVALLSRDAETLRLFDTIDIHSLTASWCFGVPYESITKKSPERFVGKTVRHAGNYDMGKRRLMQTVMTDARRFHIDVSISEWRAGQILEKFHNKAPKIRGVFHTEIRDALANNNRILINPFGRYRQFFGRWDDDLFKEGYAQLPQSTVGDHLKMAMLRVQARIPDLQIIVEAHDAFTSQLPLSKVDETVKIIKEEMEKPIDFSRCTLSRGELIIPCEVMLGEKNYRDMVRIA